MAYLRITWTRPDPTDAWTSQSIERSTTGSSGTYSQIALVASSTGSYVDENGDSTYWYRLRFYDPVTSTYDGYTNPIQGGYATGYLSLDEARRQGKFMKTEFADPELQDYINQATQRVDELTGRTWTGILTASNLYLDGAGTPYLKLRNTDVVALTAISINTTGSTFTTVTPSKVTVYPTGDIYLDSIIHSDLEATVFPLGYKTALVSYTYGNATPTDSVKELTLLLLIQKIRFNPNLDEIIRKKVKSLRYDGAFMV